MQEIYQKTLPKKICFDGIGLHSGKQSKINILPAVAGKGIVFKRVDLKNNNIVHAKFNNVTSTRLSTTLENEHGVKISTVEHLLAAFYIAGVDNAIVEINNEEVPIMDGSAKVFLKKLNEFNLIEQSQKRKYLKVFNKIELLEDEKKISIEPNDETFEVEFQLNYKNKIIGKQQNKIDFQKDKIEEISESRTFCLYEDIKKIKKLGLAKGGSLDNAVVVDDNKILNEGGLRNEKEFVNHKILDLAGDFMLAGHRLIGKISCYQGGHELTNLFLRKIFKTGRNLKTFELSDLSDTKKFQSKEINKIAVNA